MEICNYEILKFLTQPIDVDYEVYAYILRQLKPINNLSGKQSVSLIEQPFKNIISIENLFKSVSNTPKHMIDIVAIVFNVDTDDINNVGVIEFYHAFNYVFNAYTELIERENKVLHYEPDNEEIEAGLSNLNKFGRLSSIDALAGGDILKHNQIIELPYSRVFTKLFLEHEKAKYQRTLIKIKNRKYDS